MDAATLEARTVTAGAYVRLTAMGGLVPFMVGPTKVGDRLGVVRLGGHRERGETPWECAQREVLEEAGLRMTVDPPPATYRATMDDVERELTPLGWPGGGAPVAVPLLVSARYGDVEGPVSVMYLARSEDLPAPRAKAQGLLLLSADNVTLLTGLSAPTLGEYLERGGQALLARPLPLEMPLQPFAQLRWLARLLVCHPDLLDASS